MSRRKIIKKRFPKPDPVYNNYLVSILVSRLIKDGKKTLAQNIVCDALDIIAYKTESDPIEVFEQAVKNVTPLVEVKARRFGGATYQVPMEVTSFRGTNLALRWIVKASRSRTGKTIALKLAAELMDASKNSGDAMRKKQDTHKMAEANKAFAHFRY
jgi:small subunit ribosomal protein S7|uniref:Ribosomal protein S7 n=2 Tax=Pelagomonas TaxID=35676 RepID=J9QLU8_9STRA|nr:30S ribosomal protein S7 [uncultured Pelagomonas]|tara:strand:- start:1 stop:471 length:471 start_codon:yes stop_codon:yes gene_type:complete|mmetsp:Transcript_916/g.2757  ORF Transcript_916/g.2757 Transcript_916/m.2757 type:complete len:157 (+) Transcript_916:424-894(+)